MGYTAKIVASSPNYVLKLSRLRSAEYFHVIILERRRVFDLFLGRRRLKRLWKIINKRHGTVNRALKRDLSALCHRCPFLNVSDRRNLSFACVRPVVKLHGYQTGKRLGRPSSFDFRLRTFASVRFVNFARYFRRVLAYKKRLHVRSFRPSNAAAFYRVIFGRKTGISGNARILDNTTVEFTLRWNDDGRRKLFLSTDYFPLNWLNAFNSSFKVILTSTQ